MRNGDSPLLERVFELHVAAFVADLLPSIDDKRCNDLPALHWCIYTHYRFSSRIRIA